MQRIFSVLIPGLFCLMAVAVGSAPDEPDSVVQSFERELKHEPATPAPVKRDAIDQDELYRSVNRIHWTPEAQADSEPEEAAPGESDEER